MSKRSDGRRTRKVVVASWEDLQRAAPEIVAAINADPALAIAAAANPVLALEELGYDIAPDARRGIEERVRFGPKRAIRVRRLREALTKEFSQDFDPADDDAVAAAIRSRFKGELPAAAKVATDAARHRVGASERLDEALEGLRTQHPGLRAVHEYRQLVRSAPPLAPVEAYQQIRAGKRDVGIVSIRARFKNRAAEPAETPG